MIFSFSFFIIAEMDQNKQYTVFPRIVAAHRIVVAPEIQLKIDARSPIQKCPSWCSWVSGESCVQEVSGLKPVVVVFFFFFSPELE